MKKILVFAIALTALSLSSCKSFLDVNNALKKIPRISLQRGSGRFGKTLRSRESSLPGNSFR